MAKNGKRNTSKTAGNASSGTATATATCPAPTIGDSAVTPTYEQISQRAQEIWTKKGCLPGQDEQNWLEAERQLIAESSRK